MVDSDFRPNGFVRLRMFRSKKIDDPSQGYEGVMGRNPSSQRINIRSSDNNGIRKGNSHRAAAKVTEGCYGV
ncbi:hypothetical protein OROHE_001116 [Orobanche hederae]